MKFGLSDEQFKYIANTVVKPLSKVRASVYCFGPRTRGDHQKFSDLDLMIESDTKPTSLIGEIQEDLVEGNFPYKVDLVHFSDFADSYKEGYEKEKVEFK